MEGCGATTLSCQKVELAFHRTVHQDSAGRGKLYNPRWRWDFRSLQRYSKLCYSVQQHRLDRSDYTYIASNEKFGQVPVCTLPNHGVWKIENGKEMRAWFVKAFPRFSFANGGDDTLVADEEWERFAKSEGSRFPPCQYSPGLCATRGTNGIVLVGDAIHAFPPDLGQGVNAALGDVAVLDDCLYQHESLSDALEAYQDCRGPKVSVKRVVAHCHCSPFLSQVQHVYSYCR